MNEQVRQLLIEDFNKKKNKQNKLMNKKKLLHKKTKQIQVGFGVTYKSHTILAFCEHFTPASYHVNIVKCREEKL